MKMDFSVGMGGVLTTGQVGEMARVVEDSGFTYLTLVDSPYRSRDVHVMMTLAALATKRIRIGQGVVDPPEQRGHVQVLSRRGERGADLPTDGIAHHLIVRLDRRLAAHHSEGGESHRALEAKSHVPSF